MYEGMSLKIDGNRMRSNGVSFGYGDSDPFLVAKSEHFAVVRVPGSKEWSQLGSTSYFPAKWYLLEIEPVVTGELKIVKIVKNVEPGRFWRKVKDNLLSDMEWEERKLNAKN